MSINKVCVFCGSRKGKNPKYTSFARNLGQELAKNNIGLIFGGGSVGLKTFKFLSIFISGSSRSDIYGPVTEKPILN